MGFVPHYPMSGGTLPALAADEIVRSEFAVLGPVAPQAGQYPAVSRRRHLQRSAEPALAGKLGLRRAC